MSGLIVAGGKCASRKIAERYLGQYDIVIAADSGFDNALKLGLKPDILIGDMDSLKNKKHLKKYNDLKILKYPEDKDYTDTELALNYLIHEKCRNIDIIGGEGGRIDHLMAIFSIFHRKKYPSRWITSKELIYCFEDEIIITGKIGDKISFFPAGKNECKMKSYGLKWKLDDLSWEIGDAGISNSFSENTCRVILSKGRLIAVKNILS